MTPFEMLLPLGLPAVQLFLRLADPNDRNKADAAADLSQVLSGLGSIASRREADRTLDRVGDAVAARLEKTIRVEFSTADDGDIEAAARAVRNTLEDARVASTAVLVEHGLAAERLQAFCLGEAGGMRRRRDLYSTVASELFDLLLRDSCAYIVQLCLRFPDFNAEALLGVISRLDRQAAFLEDVDNVLQSLPERLVGTLKVDAIASKSRRSAEFDVAYRRAMAERYDVLQLYGLDLSYEVRRYSLSTAYLSLSATSAQSGAEPIGIETLLDGGSRVLVSGEAGAGKTTLLQWLAVNMSRNTLPRELRALHQRVPFMVKLRAYPDGRLPTLDQLAAESATVFTQNEPADWARSVFRSGRAAVLVDGLDEIPVELLPHLADWLNALTDAFPDVIVVATARPSAAAAFDQMIDGFRHVMLQPMGMSEIETFIDYWHLAMLRGERWDRFDELMEARARLTKQVRASSELRGLASSPLLCAVMCSLFHIRQQDLPRRKIELYETVLVMLLGSRDIQRGVAVEVPVSPTDQRHILKHLAGFMLTSERSEIPAQRALDQVALSLSRLKPVDSDPQAVLSYLLERSGVIRHPGPGVVDYVHKSFLDFLGASSIMDSDGVEQLVLNAERETWSYAVVLSAGLGIDRQRDALVAGLVERCRSEGARLEPVIAGCIETASDLDPGIRDAAVDCLVSWMPPFTRAQSVVLSQAGDAVLEPLNVALAARLAEFSGQLAIGSERAKILFESGEFTAYSYLAETAICLSLIGSHRSLEMLSAWPHEWREGILQRLVDVWQDFDLDEFSGQVLADLAPSEDRAIEVRDGTLLGRIGVLGSQVHVNCTLSIATPDLDVTARRLPIVRLDVRDCRPLRVDGGIDLSFIRDIDSLEQVDLTVRGRVTSATSTVRPSRLASARFVRIVGDWDDTLFARLDFLTSLSVEVSGSFVLGASSTSARLAHLVVGARSVTCESTADYGGLTHLSLTGVDDFVTFSDALLSMPNLRELELSDCDFLEDLSALDGHVALERVVIENCTNLLDLSGVENCPALLRLVVVSCPQLASGLDPAVFGPSVEIEADDAGASFSTAWRSLDTDGVPDGRVYEDEFEWGDLRGEDRDPIESEGGYEVVSLDGLLDLLDHPEEESWRGGDDPRTAWLDE